MELRTIPGRLARVFGVGLALAAFAAASGCREAEPRDPAATLRTPGAIEVVDDAARIVRLDSPARRVVSLLPATTETVVDLGGLDRLVARTDYDEEPSLQHLPSVGGGLTPSVEILASLRPDLVIAWEEAGTARIRPRLEALGIPVFAARTQDTTGIFANIERLGRLLGLDSAADSLAAAVRGEFNAVRAEVADGPRPSVLYMISVDPPMIAGPRLFIGEAIEVAGGRNAFPEATTPSPLVSLEEVVARVPDVVIVPSDDPPGAVAERLDAIPAWRELLANGRTRLETIPADLMHRPGPSIARAVRLLREVIHPDAPVRP